MDDLVSQLDEKAQIALGRLIEWTSRIFETSSQLPVPKLPGRRPFELPPLRALLEVPVFDAVAMVVRV